MSMINRYKFTKNIYKDYIVLIIKNKKYYSFDKDKKVLDYINFNNKLYLSIYTMLIYDRYVDTFN